MKKNGSTCLRRHISSAHRVFVESLEVAPRHACGGVHCKTHRKALAARSTNLLAAFFVCSFHVIITSLAPSSSLPTTLPYT
jgi:hypothetical protein